MARVMTEYSKFKRQQENEELHAKHRKEKRTSAAAKTDRVIKYKKWYKDKSMADLSVVYGPNGERKFTGHRTILANTSEWLANASKPPFVEADAKEITLHDDDPDALESMFEFSYLNTYSLPHIAPKTEKEHQQNFLHHIKVLVVADKYMARVLLASILVTLDSYFLDDQDNSSAKYLCATMRLVYRNPSVFGSVYDYEADKSHDTQNTSVVLVGNAADSHREPGNEGIDGTQADSEMALERYEESAKDWHNNYPWNKVEYLEGPPIDYLKHRIICLALSMWVKRRPDGLGDLVKEVPEFSRDLVMVALKRGWTLEQTVPPEEWQ